MRRDQMRKYTYTREDVLCVSMSVCSRRGLVRDSQLTQPHLLLSSWRETTMEFALHEPSLCRQESDSLRVSLSLCTRVCVYVCALIEHTNELVHGSCCVCVHRWEESRFQSGTGKERESMEGIGMSGSCGIWCIILPLVSSFLLSFLRSLCEYWVHRAPWYVTSTHEPRSRGKGEKSEKIRTQTERRKISLLAFCSLETHFLSTDHQQQQERGKKRTWRRWERNGKSVSSVSRLE